VTPDRQTQLVSWHVSWLVNWTERAVLLLLILYICVHTVPRAWNSLVTDFPNYFTAAQLAHDGYDASRMYEWDWLEREKDHRGIPIRVIGLVPITPFSTLFLWPFVGLKPLAAKHLWILLNLLLVVPICWMLRQMTGLNYQRLALIFALNFPFYRNLEFGQFYVLLLLLVTAACWAALKGHQARSGALVAIAAASKIFPLMFVVLFLQRRAWRALAWGAVSGAAAAGLSVAVFGWNVHRTYLLEILPWALHGEAMPPYVANASISGVLHILFLAEPLWNPNPWHSSVLCFSLLFPVLQMLVLAPAVLLIRSDDKSPRRIMLEWSAMLTASLAISTIPASYNFVLMVLPICVLSSILLERKQYGWLAALVVAYIGIGFPFPTPARISGLAILLYVPRLPLLIGVLLGIYALLWPLESVRVFFKDWTRCAWAVAMITAIVFNAHSTFVRESAVREEYAYRLPLQHEGYLNANPQQAAIGIRYIAFTLDGYRLITEDKDSLWADPAAGSSDDDLSFASGAGSAGGSGHLFAERAKSPLSEIIDLNSPVHATIEDARDPMLSADGSSLAFIRDDHGRGQLMARSAFQSGSATEVALTPRSMNVYEATFLSEGEYAFAAASNEKPAQIYLTDGTYENEPLALGESRYPALSPDGQWLAYSHFERGAWNLWIRNQKTGKTERIGNVPCNEIEPGWEGDSKTLLYSTDCGRSLWFTAVARRQVIP
jgi:Glycosyltransferase family 87/WD40-like Beta Propeller Repeat